MYFEALGEAVTQMEEQVWVDIAWQLEMVWNWRLVTRLQQQLQLVKTAS